MRVVVAVISFAVALEVTAASAQSAPPPAAAPAPAAMAPSAPGGPANLCQELVTFVRAQGGAQGGAPTTPPLAVAVTAPKPQEEVAKPPASSATQQNSGLSGQIPNSGGPGASGPQGTTQNQAAPAGSTATATAPAPAAPQPPAPQPPAPAATAAAPPAAAGAPRPPSVSPEAREKVETAARANDLGACRATAQEMRGVGLAMPAPLLALAAMDLKLLERAPGENKPQP